MDKFIYIVSICFYALIFLLYITMYFIMFFLYLRNAHLIIYICEFARYK